MGNLLSWVLGYFGYSPCASTSSCLAERDLLARLMTPHARDKPRHFDNPPPDNYCAIALLPMEMLIRVMEFVDEETLSQACPLVSRAWHDASLDPTPWRTRFDQDFGDDEPACWRLAGKEYNTKLSGTAWRRFYYEQAHQCLSRVGLEGYTSRETGVRIRLRGKLYDVTPFLDLHPGGADILLEEAGKDATQLFEDVGHSGQAEKMMAAYRIPDYDIMKAPSVVRRLYCEKAKRKVPDS